MSAGRYASLLNRVRSAGPRLGNSRADLATLEQELHDSASRTNGLDDFGDPDYREGLRVLLESIASSPYTAAQQRVIRRGGIELLLSGRLYSERGWRDHPDALKSRIAAPLVICGLPRSGTTALHKLLSVDQRFQGLEAWLSIYPMPRPPRDRWTEMREHQAVAESFVRMNEASDVYSSAHHRNADEVDECLWLMGQSFVTNLFPAAFDLPAYDAWFRAQDQRPTYERFARNLRLIGAGDPEKPWLLKNPGHLFALDALLDVFPDAMIVQIHRHPAAALASLTSLLGAARQTALGPDVPVDGIARREVSFWSTAAGGAMRVRERRAGSFHDVRYIDFVADPMRVVLDIYDAFGLRLDPPTASKMQEWIAQNPSDKHGAHVYSHRLPGVSRADVEEAFGDYIERFELT